MLLTDYIWGMVMDSWHYNFPTAEEIPAVIHGDGTERQYDHRDIVLHLKGDGLKSISYLHQSPSTWNDTLPSSQAGLVSPKNTSSVREWS